MDDPHDLLSIFRNHQSHEDFDFVQLIRNHSQQLHRIEQLEFDNNPLQEPPLAFNQPANRNHRNDENSQPPLNNFQFFQEQQ